ncbi:MAG TPA: Rpn family recombination-promoting nuclease/putative transposase [Polyangiaceae bacterium]|nr:Rpn family recombination-promoting nuclease/putative transposase [Polyangiaceae bacterium]
MSELKQPHDALFKKMFSSVLYASSELASVLPVTLVRQLDFSTLALCAGAYVDEALAGSQSDLLFSAQINGRASFVYLLFEHQSQVDALMPLRLMKYVLRVLEQHVERAGGSSRALPLPLVVPVVLYHGEKRWTAARSLQDLFDLEQVAASGVGELLPQLGFVLDDLTEQSDSALESRRLHLATLVTLWLLRDARNRARFRRAREHWIPLLALVLDLPNGAQLLETFFRYIGVVANEEEAQALSEGLQAYRPEAKEVLMTLAEKWFSEGEAKGKAEGKAETLRKLLTLKFGELPAAVSERLSSATEGELDDAIERVLSATTLDQVVL